MLINAFFLSYGISICLQSALSLWISNSEVYYSTSLSAKSLLKSLCLFELILKKSEKNLAKRRLYISSSIEVADLWRSSTNFILLLYNFYRYIYFTSFVTPKVNSYGMILIFSRQLIGLFLINEVYLFFMINY